MVGVVVRQQDALKCPPLGSQVIEQIPQARLLSFIDGRRIDEIQTLVPDDARVGMRCRRPRRRLERYQKNPGREVDAVKCSCFVGFGHRADALTEPVLPLRPLFEKYYHRRCDLKLTVFPTREGLLRLDEVAVHELAVPDLDFGVVRHESAKKPRVKADGDERRRGDAAKGDEIFGVEILSVPLEKRAESNVFGEKPAAILTKLGGFRSVPSSAEPDARFLEELPCARHYETAHGFGFISEPAHRDRLVVRI